MIVCNVGSNNVHDSSVSAQCLQGDKVLQLPICVLLLHNRLNLQYVSGAGGGRECIHTGMSLRIHVACIRNVALPSRQVELRCQWDPANPGRSAGEHKFRIAQYFATPHALPTRKVDMQLTQSRHSKARPHAQSTRKIRTQSLTQLAKLTYKVCGGSKTRKVLETPKCMALIFVERVRGRNV